MSLHHRSLSLVAALVLVIWMPVSAQDEEDNVPAPSDALFNPHVVQRIDLRVHSADWEMLKQDYRANTYYPADLVFGDQTVRNTGIRSRGGGSRSPHKPGLRVDFDRYAAEQTFLGLKSLVLDNLTQDASGIRETLAMRVFARLGIPAPREAHVRLYVNGHYAGLYAVVESVDKRFLARIFGSIDGNVQNDGYLFEFDWNDDWTFTYLGSDFKPYRDRFKPQTNETRSDHDKFAPIETLVRLANELYPERYLPDLTPYIDLPAFVRFVAAQNFVAEQDGFLGYAGVNNFYLYRLEDSLQHVLIPWDDDNAFKGVDYPIFFRHDDNVLMANAMRVPELRALYVEVLREAVRIAEEPVLDDDVVVGKWLEHETQRQLDLIRDAMHEDPVRPYAFGDHERARDELLEFARERTANVREQLWRHGYGGVGPARLTPR